MVDRTVPLVEVYSREGCHLCDEALEAIRGMASHDMHFDLQVIDIESDDQLHMTHLERIPVVAINGVEVAELEVDPRQLRDLIKSAASIAPDVND